MGWVRFVSSRANVRRDLVDIPDLCFRLLAHYPVIIERSLHPLYNRSHESKNG